MFVLRKKQIGGYEFGEKTTYSEHHLGTDYSADCGTDLFMPFNGKIKSLYGKQGGNTVYAYPDGQDVVIRLMHLRSSVADGEYKEGDVIGLTGNSGSLTTGCHLHLDISKNEVNINDFSNFINPEEFNWGGNMNEEREKKIIFNILEHEWRLMHNYAELDDAGRASIRREIDEIYPQWDGNEWAFAPKQDQWFKESGLTQPCNCDSVVAEEAKKCDARVSSCVDENVDLTKKVQDLKKTVDHLEEKLGQELSAVELIKLGVKKLFKAS